MPSKVEKLKLLNVDLRNHVPKTLLQLARTEKLQSRLACRDLYEALRKVEFYADEKYMHSCGAVMQHIITSWWRKVDYKERLKDMLLDKSIDFDDYIFGKLGGIDCEDLYNSCHVDPDCTVIINPSDFVDFQLSTLLAIQDTKFMALEHPGIEICQSYACDDEKEAIFEEFFHGRFLTELKKDPRADKRLSMTMSYDSLRICNL